ncbi:MAG TPA: flagellar basal body-associated protein FliL [Rhodanobacteraceae bacterium]|jgi:flagellar FliL protein|nr:flagellar basal body-associated protein FliL [Rhodanobacteraceae bacterium]
MKSSQQGIAKLWLILIILLVVLLGAGGAAGWLLLGKHAKPAASDKTAAVAKRAEKPVFLDLDSFTVNLEGGDRLLYVGITLQLGNESTQEFLRAHLPQVRNRLLMVLSNQDAGTLITSDGKQKLAEAIRTSLLKQFAGTQPALLLDKVLFTQFIVQ